MHLTVSARFLISSGREGEYLWAPNDTRLTAHAISRGPQISQVPGPNPPRNGLARMKTIMHWAVRFTGA